MRPEWMVDLPDICTQDVSNYAQKKLLEWLIMNGTFSSSTDYTYLQDMLEQLEEK